MIHQIAENAFLGRWDGRGALLFFMLQAVGITLESIFIQVFQSPNSKNAPRTYRSYWFGYLWVWTWLVITAPFLLKGFVEGELAKDTPHFSPIFGVWRGQWTVSG